MPHLLSLWPQYLPYSICKRFTNIEEFKWYGLLEYFVLPGGFEADSIGEKGSELTTQTLTLNESRTSDTEHII
jgi:hypothetical protein